MQRILLETGQQFGRLTVQHFIGVSIHGKSLYRCSCSCGNQDVTAIVSELKNGHTQSCGCLFKEKRVAGTRTTHGQSLTAEHRAWKNMRQRCNNPNHPKYVDYGQRGIKICKKWNDFETFLKDMGPKPKRGHKKNGHALSVDRINNDGNYAPKNCKWSTAHQQKINQRPRRWWKKPEEKRDQNDLSSQQG